jgi:hypothetical protein
MLRKITAVVAAVLGVAGCSGEGENGFKDSRPEFFREVKTALATSNIPFRVDAEGFIRYSSRHAAAVTQIKDRLEKEMSGGVSWKLEDQESRDYLKSLLASMGMKYWVQPRSDGEWILWHPQSEKQKEEIGLKVVEHSVGSRRAKSAAKAK